MEHTCAHTLHWDDSATVSACSPVSKLAHAIPRRQRDREHGKWRQGKETYGRMAGGKKTRKGRGGGALRMGD